MKHGKHPFLRDLKENRVKWLMLLPAAIVVILMCYIPMGGIVLAFKEYNYHDGIFGSPWVAFKNFEYFFQSGKAWSVTRNTILYNLAFLCVNTFLQITCAILLSELAGKWFKRITQSVMFFPYFISWVVVGAFIYNMFNYEFGAVNTLLRSLGLDPVDIYSNKVVWPFILIAVSAFKNVGYGTVMYLASIMNIDGQLYEAADLDGANMWQKIRHITLPGIRPTVVILFLLAIGTIMKGDFQMFWQVTGNNPMVLEVTDPLAAATAGVRHDQRRGPVSVHLLLPLGAFGQQAGEKGGARLRAVLKGGGLMASKTKTGKKPVGRDRVAFDVLSVAVLTVLSLFCLLPFWLVISGSFSDQASILTHGYRLIPETFSLDAYQTLFKIPGDLLRAYGVTIFVTATGTFLGLLFTSMAAYVLASSTFRYRYQMSFFFYFTSIFGGGLVPWYIFNTKYLHFHNSIIALILPILINVTYLLILKSYMAGIPEALYESARLDGAGDFTIYLRVAMPLCKAGLATVGLFIALNYWNDWYDAMLFLDEGRSDLYPLQYYLNNILTKAQAIAQAAARSGLPMSEVPSEPMKLAMTVVATGPIILLYPFLQKYFVKGVTIGAVKG